MLSCLYDLAGSSMFEERIDIPALNFFTLSVTLCLAFCFSKTTKSPISIMFLSQFAVIKELCWHNVVESFDF